MFWWMNGSSLRAERVCYDSRSEVLMTTTKEREKRQEKGRGKGVLT